MSWSVADVARLLGMLQAFLADKGVHVSQDAIAKLMVIHVDELELLWDNPDALVDRIAELFRDDVEGD